MGGTPSKPSVIPPDEGGKKEKEDEKERESVMQQILKGYPVKGPRIGFRYDSRPIKLALEKGYVAADPTKATITEGGENQNMVGVALNYVGSLNYKPYALINADTRTKKTWTEQGYKSFFWTAVVVRSGGYTFEWLLENRITDPKDRDKMKRLVLTRKGTEVDRELNEIAEKYTGAGIKNIGSTEMVTTEIPPADILGYFEIRENKGETTILAYTALKDITKIEGYTDIPMADSARYDSFVATKGTIGALSKFI